MPIRTIFIVCGFLLAGPFCPDSRGNDPVPPSASNHSPGESEFQVPKRPAKSESPRGYDLKNALGESGIKVGICIGIFLIALLLLSRKKTVQSIPREALEVLGAIPLANRQNIQLIRFGQKLVLVEASASGLKPISEITDPAEVNRMLDLIRPRTQ